MIFSIIVASVFVIGGLVCYASFAAAANADRQTEEWFRLKMQEKDAEKYHDNK